MKALIIENIKTNGLGQQPHNDQEEWVFHKWNLRSLCKDKQEHNTKDSARWDSPSVNWLKIKFDGASRGNPGIAGCGVVIRNSYGDKVGFLAIPIGSQTNQVSKAFVSLHVLIYSKSLNLMKVWVEGDSLNIINCLNKITQPSWTIINIIFQAIRIINSFDICIITHNFREANRTAHWAANVACLSEHKVIWDNNEPLLADGHQFIDYDKLRCKQKCFNNDGVRDL